MKQQFNDIKGIVEIHEVNAQKHLSKLMEEIGELAQGINKIYGQKTKKKNETQEKIIKNIKEEIADSLQILFSIAVCFNIPYHDLKEELDKKNTTYSEFVNSLKLQN